MEVKRSRRWWRYSLRTFLVVVTLFCVWLGVLANRAREQKRAVEKLKQLGEVCISYTDEFDGMQMIKEPPRFKWFTDFIGRDLFYSVNSVSVKGPIQDEDLKLFEALPNLVMLSFDNCKEISDDGLKHLAQLAKLRQFSLEGTDINGSGFQYLSSLKNLKQLGLMNTKFDDNGANNLKLFPILEGISFTDTQITDSGLKAFESMTSLKSIFLLRVVRDANGAVHVQHVEGKFTPAGIARLKTKLPKCKVDY